MLRITVTETIDAATLRLEGKLAELWVEELERCWEQLLARRSNQRLTVDLKAVTFVDLRGMSLLARMRKRGARLISGGLLMEYLLQGIERNAAANASMQQTNDCRALNRI
jgi:ABC-type transporter Mla MlaB component